MGDVNWKRTFAVSAMICAVLLVLASIYLHVQQKHHLGRLNHIDLPPIAVAVETDTTAMYIDNYLDLYDTVNRSEELSTQNKHSYGYDWEDSATNDKHDSLRLSDACLRCICTTISGCQPCVDTQPCNKYRISLLYWSEGGKQTPGPTFDLRRSMASGYEVCLADDDCAARTVEAYMLRYGKDCNGDGIIDCRDYVAIHILGPIGCLGAEIPPPFVTRMEYCIDEELS